MLDGEPIAIDVMLENWKRIAEEQKRENSRNSIKKDGKHV